MVNDRRWAAVEVLDQRVGGIDSQVMINRCQEISGTADAFDDIFATLVGGSDDLTGADTTASPDI